MGKFGLGAVVSPLACLLVAGCATPLEQSISGFTCCNLRGSSGWISSNNVQGGDLIPAGTSIELTSIKRQFYAYGKVGQKEYGLRDDSAKNEQDTLRWIKRVVVAEDPRTQVASWPTDVRTAIGAARVFVGMTRTQVAIAIGYPSSNDTPDLGGDIWRYWTAVEDLPVDLRFDREGKVAELIGKASAVQTLELQR